MLCLIFSAALLAAIYRVTVDHFGFTRIRKTLTAATALPSKAWTASVRHTIYAFRSSRYLFLQWFSSSSEDERRSSSSSCGDDSDDDSSPTIEITYEDTTA